MAEEDTVFCFCQNFQC